MAGESTVLRAVAACIAGACCFFFASCDRNVSRLASDRTAASDLREAIDRTLATSKVRIVLLESTSAKNDPTEPDGVDPDNREVTICDGPDRLDEKEWAYDSEPVYMGERIYIGGRLYESTPDHPTRFEFYDDGPMRPPPANVRCAYGPLMGVRDDAQAVVRTGSVYRFVLHEPGDRPRPGSATVTDGRVVRLVLHSSGDRQVITFDRFGTAPRVRAPDEFTRATPGPTCGPNGEAPSPSPGEVATSCEGDAADLHLSPPPDAPEHGR
jgi:hypothetical protein